MKQLLFTISLLFLMNMSVYSQGGSGSESERDMVSLFTKDGMEVRVDESTCDILKAIAKSTVKYTDKVPNYDTPRPAFAKVTKEEFFRTIKPFLLKAYKKREAENMEKELPRDEIDLKVSQGEVDEEKPIAITEFLFSTPGLSRKVRREPSDSELRPISEDLASYLTCKAKEEAGR